MLTFRVVCQFFFLWPVLHAFASPTSISVVQETAKDAALIARRLLAETSIGTMATRYPLDHPTLPGFPFALQEYYASCYNNGSLLLLILPISRHSRNILQSPEHAASLSVWRTPRPSADQARVSLIGNVTILRDDGSINKEMQDCYLKEHPDAAKWLPNDPDSPHVSFWSRFDPVGVYFVGGFGDEHYIGEIPLHLYREAHAEVRVLSVDDKLRIQS